MSTLAATIGRGATGSRPAASEAGRLYFDTTTSIAYRDNGSSWDIAIPGSLTNPMTTTGDIIYSSDNSGTPARLAIGAAGGALSRINGAVAWNSGTSFPGSAAAGDRYWRTDLALEAYYDGTRWLTTTLYDDIIGGGYSSLYPLSATGTASRSAIAQAGIKSLWAENFYCSFFVAGGGSALSGSHKWVCTLVKQVAGTTIATVNIDSGSSAAWRASGAVSIAALIATTEFELEVVSTKTGTPGSLYLLPRMTYRLVLT